jgi:hypothetical protein
LLPLKRNCSCIHPALGSNLSHHAAALHT